MAQQHSECLRSKTSDPQVLSGAGAGVTCSSVYFHQESSPCPLGPPSPGSSQSRGTGRACLPKGTPPGTQSVSLNGGGAAPSSILAEAEEGAVLEGAMHPSAGPWVSLVFSKHRDHFQKSKPAPEWGQEGVRREDPELLNQPRFSWGPVMAPHNSYPRACTRPA